MGFVLLVHMDNDRIRAVRSAMLVAKLRCAAILETDLDKPLGSLAGLRDFVPESRPDVPELQGYDPEKCEIAEEMMVFCNVTRRELDGALAAMKRLRLNVSLKAVLTPDNVNWNPRQLFYAISSERSRLKGQS